MNHGVRSAGVPRAVMMVCVLAFSLMTVALQVRATGFPYIDSGPQLERHRAVLDGTAHDPWQYRILSEFVVESVLRLVTIAGLPHPVATAFIGFRVLQNLLIFWLAAIYFKSFGLDERLVLLGLACLAWGMTHAFYDSDLQFNTYSDVIFYLVAALLLIKGQILWIPAVCFLAALNRETSLLIPFLALGEKNPDHRNRWSLRNPVVVAGVGLLLGVVAYSAVRLVCGPRSPSPATHPMGLSLVAWNLLRYHSWVFLFATLGPLPILAFLGRSRWPRRLRVWSWALVPTWCLVHLFASVIAEARLFLVPHILVFIPGALLAVKGVGGGESANRQAVLA